MPLYPVDPFLPLHPLLSPFFSFLFSPAMLYPLLRRLRLLTSWPPPQYPPSFSLYSALFFLLLESLLSPLLLPPPTHLSLPPPYSPFQSILPPPLHLPSHPSTPFPTFPFIPPHPLLEFRPFLPIRLPSPPPRHLHPPISFLPPALSSPSLPPRFILAVFRFFLAAALPFPPPPIQLHVPLSTPSFYSRLLTILRSASAMFVCSAPFFFSRSLFYPPNSLKTAFFSLLPTPPTPANAPLPTSFPPLSPHPFLTSSPPSSSRPHPPSPPVLPSFAPIPHPMSVLSNFSTPFLSPNSPTPFP